MALSRQLVRVFEEFVAVAELGDRFGRDQFDDDGDGEGDGADDDGDGPVATVQMDDLESGSTDEDDRDLRRSLGSVSEREEVDGEGLT